MDVILTHFRQFNIPIVGSWLRHTRQSGFRTPQLQQQNIPSIPSSYVRNNQPTQSFQPINGQSVTPTTQQTPYQVDASDTAEDNEIDLHNKEFCVDVSSYQPVVWEERPGESCTTLMRMMPASTSPPSSPR